MSSPQPPTTWKVYRFGLLVTGKGEQQFLNHLFRSLCERMALTGRGTCEFSILAKVEQLTPRSAPKHRLTMPGQKKHLPTRDEEMALRALGFLRQGGDFVILIDDLEGSRRDEAAAVYNRYREAFDHVLPEQMRSRVSVHFLVNMLEAYYFAHAQAINEVMGTDWTDYDGDVETIGHPKGDLKKRIDSFDEIEHGNEIVKRLDVPRVLSEPTTCASLRTLFGWCWRALELQPGEDYRLAGGCYFEVTRPQIDQLPLPEG